MAASKNSNPRNLRNSPYVFDELGGRFHRTAAGVLWRWRTELTLVGSLVAAVVWLAQAITLYWAVAVLGSLALVLAAVPRSRRFITARAWCVLARHRLQKLCWEARLHTRSGRLPRPFQDHDVSPRMVKGRSMERPAHRVASVTSVRPARRSAPIARLRSAAMILGPDRVLTLDLSS